jgi:hypothetical protein
MLVHSTTKQMFKAQWLKLGSVTSVNWWSMMELWGQGVDFSPKSIIVEYVFDLTFTDFQKISGKNIFPVDPWPHSSTTSLQGVHRGHVKGQLILKGHLGIFNSSKKRTWKLWFLPYPTEAEIFHTFFGRIENTKKTFLN